MVLDVMVVGVEVADFNSSIACVFTVIGCGFLQLSAEYRIVLWELPWSYRVTGTPTG